MSYDPQMSEWGNPHGVMSMYRILNKIGIRREPGELKHLSNRRKRKKNIDFQSSGERNGKSPNRDVYIPGFGLHK